MKDIRLVKSTVPTITNSELFGGGGGGGKGRAGLTYSNSGKLVLHSYRLKIVTVKIIAPLTVDIC